MSELPPLPRHPVAVNWAPELNIHYRHTVDSGKKNYNKESITIKEKECEAVLPASIPLVKPSKFNWASDDEDMFPSEDIDDVVDFNCINTELEKDKENRCESGSDSSSVIEVREESRGAQAKHDTVNNGNYGLSVTKTVEREEGERYNDKDGFQFNFDDDDIEPITSPVWGNKDDSLHLTNADLHINETELFESKYELQGTIGQGTFGTVWSCTLRGGEEETFAAKIVERKFKLTDKDIYREIIVLNQLRGCPQILTYDECFKEPTRWVIITEEIHGGELFDHLERYGSFTEEEASLVIRDVARALAYSHSRGIAHRDLKPENILCVEEDTPYPCKVADFGLSNVATAATTPALQTPVGTAQFMAPEVVDVEFGDCLSYTKKCDIWALGVIMYMLLVGYPPFMADCGKDCGWKTGNFCEECMDILLWNIKEGEVRFPQSEWANISDDAVDLLKCMLCKDVDLRYSAEHILHHPWLAGRAPKTFLPSPCVFSKRKKSSLLASGRMSWINLLSLDELPTATTIQENTENETPHSNGNKSDNSDNNKETKLSNGKSSVSWADMVRHSSECKEEKGGQAIPITKQKDTWSNWDPTKTDHVSWADLADDDSSTSILSKSRDSSTVMSQSCICYPTSTNKVSPVLKIFPTEYSTSYQGVDISNTEGTRDYSVLAVRRNSQRLFSIGGIVSPRHSSMDFLPRAIRSPVLSPIPSPSSSVRVSSAGVTSLSNLLTRRLNKNTRKE